MNWLKKLASVTFRLTGSSRIAQPKTISNLANDLYTWSHGNVPRYFFKQERVMIEADGMEPDELTGTINWYFQPEDLGGNIPPELAQDIPMYMEQWIQEELAQLGFQTRIRGPEQSKLFHNFHVYRLDILNNPTQDYPSMPYLNISNQNAGALFKALGLTDPQGYLEGSVDLKALLRRIQFAESRASQFTRSRTDSNETGNVQFIDFGLDEEQMKYYLTELTRIVNFGLEQGFTALEWS